MTRRATLLVLLLLTALPGSTLPIEAQSVRPGIRLSLTRVDPMGGFTASGFLVVPASRIARTPAPECGEGAVRIEATGRDARGRIRGAHLIAIVTPVAREVAFGSGPCDASLGVELEDGTTLSPDRGAIRAQLVGAGGVDATISASTAGPTGVPTTVTGHVALPSG